MKSVHDVAEELALAHKAEDPETTAIYLSASSQQADEIRLVEVSGSLAGSPGEVLPFRFASRADLGVPYASSVVLLSEADWKRVLAGELALPPGWGLPNELRKIA